MSFEILFSFETLKFFVSGTDNDGRWQSIKMGGNGASLLKFVLEKGKLDLVQVLEFQK